MDQVENEEVVKYDKSNKHFYWYEKIIRDYKDKDKFEDKNGIISMFENETKIDVETAFEVNVKCLIVFKFKEGKI